MKKLFFLLLLFCGLQVAKSQNTTDSVIQLKKEDLEGRWIIASIEDSLRRSDISDPTTIYLFKNDMMFHIGEVTGSLILFNITGRYSIDANTVRITYRNYLEEGAQDKIMIFRVLSLGKNEMVVSIEDYDYTYTAILRRQFFR